MAKIIKIYRSEISNPMSENFKLASGTIIPVLSMGEKGRGRSLAIFPLKNKKGDEDIFVSEVEETTTRSGKLAFRIKKVANDRLTADRHVSVGDLLIITPPEGYRGSGSMEIVNDRLEVIETANKADGHAGRVSFYPSYLCRLKSVEDGIIAKVHTSGRTYGRPDTYILFIENGEISSLPEEEYELL